MFKKMMIVSIFINSLIFTNVVPMSFASVPVIAPGLQLSINGQPVKVDYEGYIVTATQTAYVPIRFVTEGLGGTVAWNKVKKEVIIHSKDGKKISLIVGSNIAHVEGNEQILPHSPSMSTPRVMVPVRFVSEVMGAKVNAFKDVNQVEHVDIKL